MGNFLRLFGNFHLAAPFRREILDPPLIRSRSNCKLWAKNTPWISYPKCIGDSKFKSILMPTNIKLLFTHLNSKCQNDSRNKNKMKRSHCHCCYSQGRREWPRAATDVSKDTSPPIVKISRFTHNYSTEFRYHRVYSSVLRYHAQWKQDGIPVDIVPPACHTCFGGHHWMSGEGGRGGHVLWCTSSTPSPVDRQTPVKTLPFRNFVTHTGFPLDLENLEKWEYTWETWKYHGILKNLINIMEKWHETWKNLVATKNSPLTPLKQYKIH